VTTQYYVLNLNIRHRKINKYSSNLYLCILWVWSSKCQLD